MATPEGLNNVPPEVLAWARDTIGAKPKPVTPENVPVAATDFSVRILPGTDISGIDLAKFIELDELTREIVAIDRDQKVRKPLVRDRFVEITDELPGVVGTHREPDKGNVNVTAVPYREVAFDDPAIKASLDQRAGEVYIPQTLHQFAYEGRLKTVDGTLVSAERVSEVIKHALLGLGIEETFVNENNIKREAERRDARQLAQTILDGAAVKGISVTFDKRVEPDAVVSHLPIKVRRPRRRRIILKHKQPGQ